MDFNIFIFWPQNSNVDSELKRHVVAVVMAEGARMFVWSPSYLSDICSACLESLLYRTCQKYLLPKFPSSCKSWSLSKLLGRPSKANGCKSIILTRLPSLCSKKYSQVEEFLKPSRLWAPRGRKEASTLLYPPQRKCMHSTQGSWVE